MKKKASKSKAAKSVRSLPAKALNTKAAKDVKGGTSRGTTVKDEGPKETVTFEYGGLVIK